MEEDLSGQIVRGYELREKVGTDGFGAVYRAYHKGIDREVAIKIILPEFVNKPEFVQRFKAEARLMPAWNTFTSCRFTITGTSWAATPIW